MPSGISGFQPQRLIQARDAREMTAVALSEVVGVSPATISQYETGRQKPRQDTLEKLICALNVHRDFLLHPAIAEKPTRIFYRSMSSATKSARTRAEARYEWFLEVLAYELEYFDFPSLNLPKLGVPEDFRKITREMIEEWAERTRAHWSLGVGPISNIVQTLESNGVVVWRTLISAETLDAFSEYRVPHPVVVLSSEKENYFRSRTDAAHELGHLVMHTNVDRKSLTKASDFKILEDQAHYFGGAFILPASSFHNELWGMSLDTFRSLKPRWNASIGLQIRRCCDLGLLSEDQEKRLWINRSRRGWHRQEPLDASTEPERPTLMAKGMQMLIDAKVKTPQQIVNDLNLLPKDVENIAGVPAGFFSGMASDGEPRFRNKVSNVIPFRRQT